MLRYRMEYLETPVGHAPILIRDTH
jgi:hypothetical protein